MSIQQARNYIVQVIATRQQFVADMKNRAAASTNYAEKTLYTTAMEVAEMGIDDLATVLKLVDRGLEQATINDWITNPDRMGK